MFNDKIGIMIVFTPWDCIFWLVYMVAKGDFLCPIMHSLFVWQQVQCVEAHNKGFYWNQSEKENREKVE